jgi:c-di-GMP-binding flagellar brake protein YcgR
MSTQLPDKESLPGNRARVWFEGDFWITGMIVSALGGIEVRGRAPRPVLPGTPVIVEIGLPDGVYRFHSQLRRNDGSSLVFGLPSGDAIEHQQRRQYYRVEVDLPALLSVNGQEMAARLINLSGGGARVQTATPPEAGTRVDVVFELQGRPLSASGKVVRVQQGGPGEFPEFGLSFVCLKPEVQDRIVGYTFSRQIKAARGTGSTEPRRPQPPAARAAAPVPPRAAVPAAAQAVRPPPPAPPPPSDTDQDLIERTRKFIELLPPGLAPEVKRSVVLASLAALGVQPERMLSVLHQRRDSILSQEQRAERECEGLRSQQGTRLAELEQDRAQVQSRLESESAALQQRATVTAAERAAVEEMAGIFRSGASCSSPWRPST